MYSPSKQEISYLRTLVMIPIVIGVFCMFFKPNYEQIQKFAEKKISKVHIPESVKSPIIKRFANSNSTVSNQIYLNYMDKNELSTQLGINSKNAQLIVEERNKRFFSNWEDFKERLPSLAGKVDEFKQLGAEIGG